LDDRVRDIKMTDDSDIHLDDRVRDTLQHIHTHTDDRLCNTLQHTTTY